MQPLLLHAHATGPNPIKIAIALEALRLPYSVKMWRFGDDPQNGVKGESFLKINENGRVPALEDPNNGVVSWESGACLNYIRRVYDKKNLLGPVGDTEQDRVDFEKWEYFLLTTLGPMTGQTNWFRHYHPTKNEDALNRYSEQAYRCYEVLEGQLKKSDGCSVLPGKVTAVDYHFEPWVRQYNFAGLSLDKYPLIKKWLDEMAARDEVQQADYTVAFVKKCKRPSPGAKQWAFLYGQSFYIRDLMVKLGRSVQGNATLQATPFPAILSKEIKMNLSWPQSVQYQAEEDAPAVSDPNGNQVAQPPDTDTQTHVTTYNGVPRELLRKAQTVIGDEIRVLDLRRGSREDPLVGSLRKVRLSDPIVYEPLSYTWTDYDDANLANDDTKYEANQTIFLENADTFMNIGANCEKALRSVRKPTTERRIWVDAICVNQDDPEERSRQVDLMRKIFARAFTVLVYLGQKSMLHRSSLAMSLLGQPDRLRDVDGLDVDERSSLFFLFRRPYFRRMWIVQEVALAPTLELHCGPSVTYLSAFAEKPLEAIFGSGIAHPPWLKHAKYTADPTQSAPSTGMSRAEHVLRLLFDTVSCSCKDDRDRVFALLSLLQSSEEDWLRADYNLSTIEVYSGIAAFLATNGLGWAVLMLAPRLAPNGHSDLPSWVPNWKVLGDAGLEGPELLDHMITRSQNFRLSVVSGVTRSGVISVRGKILGPVTASDCGLAYMAKYRDPMRKYHQVDLGYFDGNSGPGVSSLRSTGQFTWTLAKPAQSPFDDSWECHIETGLRRMPPRNAQYIAVMLEEKKTILILKQDDSTHDHYTLVEIGMPLIWGVIPSDWAWDESGRCIELCLQRLSISAWDDARLHNIPLSPERFPRLWGYPHLWGYNPSTSSMSLKHKAVHYILSTDWTALNLWLEWQKQAVVGVKILSDKLRLRHLIDELHSLEEEDYKQIEVRPELGSSWALEDFLSLFIKDPLKAGPMEWPGTQMDGDQSYDESAALALLMQWAATTHRFLVHLRPNDKSGITWLLTTRSPQVEDPYPAAIAVARSQRLTAPAFTNGHETLGSERAEFLLRKILQQSSESTEAAHDQQRSMSSRPRLYWDWKKFESSVEQALSVLRDIQPDMERLGSCLNSPTPDILRADAHQLLAAHGVDLKNNYTEIRVK